MPIDPNIALSVQAPQMPNLGQSLLQGQQMALQRQQMLSLQAERDAQTQDIQQKTLAAQALARNNAAIDDIMKTAFTPDPDTGAMLLNTNAIQQGMVKANLGHLWPQMSESIDRMNQSALTANAERRKQLASNLWALQQAPDAVKPHAALTVIAGLKANNVMTPDHVQTVLQQLGPQPTVDAVNAMVQQYGAALPEFQALKTKYAADQADLAEKQAKAAQESGAAAESTVRAAGLQKQQDIEMLAAAAGQGQAAYAAAYGQLPPSRQTAFIQPQAWKPTTQATTLRMGLTPGEAAQNAIERARLAEEQRKTNLQFDPFGLSGGTGGGPLPGAAMGGQPVGGPATGAAPATPPQGGGTAPSAGAVPGRNMAILSKLPAPLQATVTSVLDGRMAIPGGSALRMPYWQGVINLANQVDPTFDTVNFNARSKTRQDFTSGASAKQVNALNTVAGHLASLSQAADNLNNSWSPAYNSVANFLTNATGRPEVKQYNATQNAVVDELTRVWRQTGGTEQDIKSWADQLGASNSPAQIHGVVSQIGDLLESKLQALQDQNTQGMGTAAIQVVTPQTRAVLDGLRGKGAASRSGPTVGTRRTINGQLAEWDGQGWKAVQ